MTMDIFWLINLIRMTDLTISQIKHLVKLVSGLVNKNTQSSQIGKCPNE
jgi:hypothetical protein